MNYELSILEELIAVTINPQNIDISVVESQFKSWLSLVLSEKKRIKERMAAEVFTLSDQRKIELYIQRHQMALIHLADILLGYLMVISLSKDQEQKKNLKDLYRQLCIDLVTLLTFIEDYFSCYYNQNLHVPFSYRLLSQWNIGEQLQIIERQFQFLLIDKCLLNIILQPIRRIADETCNMFSFQYLRFCKILAEELILFGKEQINEDTTPSLHTLLYYLNFNSNDYLNYCLQTIFKEIKAIDNLIQKQEKLGYYIQLLHQQQTKPGFSLYPQMPAIADFMLKRLTEEYKFLKQGNSEWRVFE